MGLKHQGLPLLCAALLLADSACSPGSSGASSGPWRLSQSDYLPMCAAALIEAQTLTADLDDAEVVPGVDPKILSNGPPERLQCGISRGPREIGAVTFNANCGSWQDSACVTVISAVLNGRVAYVNQSIADKDLAAKGLAPGRHHRRRRAEG
jgi:hypothetical protein